MTKIKEGKIGFKTNKTFNQLTAELKYNLERMGVNGLSIDIRYDTKTNVSLLRFNYKGKNYEMRSNTQKNVLFNMYALSRRVEWKARMHLLGIEEFDISVSPYLMIEGKIDTEFQPQKANIRSYSILGIPEYSSKDEIEKRYRQLVKSFHPDMALSDEAKIEFEKRMAEINQAYTEIRKEREF